MARELVMAATRIVRGIGSSCYRGLPVLEKGSETDTPPVILVLMPTHTSTHTHTNTKALQTGITAMVRCTLPLSIRHAVRKEEESDPATCPVDSCNTLRCPGEERGRGVGVKPNWLKPGRVQAFEKAYSN